MAAEGTGGYCIYATVATAGEEEALALHWVGSAYIGGSDTPIDDTAFGTNTSGLDRFNTQLQITYSQEVLDDSGIPVDYSYNTGNAMGAEWYQPKESDYFLNQMRFQLDDNVIGYHYDGSSWYTGTSTAVTGAAGLVSSSAVIAASVYFTLY